MTKMYSPGKGISCSIAILLCIFFSNNVHAQDHQTSVTSQPGVYVYYINISGINSKSDVRTLEPAMSKKPGVLSFVSKKFPPLYFMLRTSAPVSEAVIKEWLRDFPYRLTYFGTEMYSKERSFMENKENNSHH